jgi:CTP synthase (UTP-ammonia lyase)
MLTVGIIGDFDPGAETHRATNEALRHAAQALDMTVTATWLPTSELSTGAVEQHRAPASRCQDQWCRKKPLT